MSQIHILKTHITGLGAQQYRVPEYDIREEISLILKISRSQITFLNVKLSMGINHHHQSPDETILTFSDMTLTKTMISVQTLATDI